MQIDVKKEFNLTGEIREQLDAYIAYLLEENEKYNLTSIKDTEDIYYKHILDSLSGYAVLKNYFGPDLYSMKIADIGTGAGFPGIPLYLYDKKLDITLIDSNSKKINFLDKFKENHHYTFKTINGNYREIQQKFDICLFRAFKSLYDFLFLGKRIFAEKCFILAYKGTEGLINSEINEIKSKKIGQFIKTIEIHPVFGILEKRHLVELLWERL